MATLVLPRQNIGIEVLDIARDSLFAGRKLHARNPATQMEGLRRMAVAFVESPETILRELVQAAVELCGADSAGISLEREGGTEEEFYHWVATAGQYSDFLNAVLPRYPSACTICLERGRAQHFRVGKAFFDLMKIDAPVVTDGVLLPWQVDGQRGTIFIMAHGRTEAFDSSDCTMLEMLAQFAAMGIRQQRQKEQLLRQAGAAAAAEMANDLAHRINNPLQSLTNVLYMAAEGYQGDGARQVGEQALADLQNLSALVSKLLALPYRAPQ
jgi:hypothetical protein